LPETTANDLGSIYTIGHSNHPLEAFLDLLRDSSIEVLIDTRSSPYSRFSPQFNREALKAAVCAEGIKYGFYGRELGGRPDDEDFYDEEGRVLYSSVAKSFLFNNGLERLTRGLQIHRTALLCSEENPSVCHRRLLVSRVLFDQGVAVFHIRGNGEIQSEADLRREEEREKSRQPALFDDEEMPAWKSIQSVLPKARLRTSSDD
jgi:uncharacterized protein (DUF488 family)